MLYLIGLGLHDESDLSFRTIDELKKCDAIYCEFYTGKWFGDLKKLEKTIGKKITLLNRENVESDMIVDDAEKRNVSLLIPGDPLTATTHMELVIEAKKRNIEVKVIHSSSVYTAVAESGLMIYKFGRTTTLVKPQKGFNPRSQYEPIIENKKAGLHTLILLDIGMTVREGAELLIKNKIVSKDDKIVACCRLGGDQVIKYDSALSLTKEDFPTPAALIIPGKMHFKEEEALELLK
ncbi:MAG: diphthine synthase [Candidatus Aenigmatarchaeota archaeon]